MKTIFTNRHGKHRTAVYFCEIPDLPEVTDEWIEALCPRAHGISQVKFNVTRANGRVRWQHLVVNARATVAYDIEGAIARKLKWGQNDPRIVVLTEAALPGVGTGHRTGSTRVDITPRPAKRRYTFGVTAR